jgi:hypothetical protein
MRKPVPDILSKLTREKPNASITEYQNNDIPVCNNSSMTEDHNAIIMSKSHTRKPARNNAIKKEKATFYLSKKIGNELEKCWMKIRTMRGDKAISKTDIVEQALEEVIEEFNKTKTESQLYGKLLCKKAIKP